MKIQPVKLMALSILAAAALLAAASAHAGFGYGEEEGRSARGNSNGFWNRGASTHYATSAEISQALYGTPPEPYDTHTDQEDAPEITKAG